ncbi:trypco2 family protein [Paracraurococcus ruber]|uniref:Trypsin-co-occurring domain-containing protein n=1 Tax=Paracraurococcus ruber TaxID=77675 RepID=A0ABS1CUB1_9PROT|nr:trypco2 family protein [Paracraurococcus ruber]MBK1657786.1 hypothetical protein [Paracraurococcus ruber]TDG27676.1 hypothetical protein E2C05_22155 [Paracraurococcus ruber]
MSDGLDKVPLTAAIAGLRRQIREAAEQASKLPPGERFRITGVELELTVVAEDAASTGGEVGWWVFKAKVRIPLKSATDSDVMSAGHSD